ncbi:MAG: 3-phosphoshikimate 1-carboxyvinyltransferase, partial [Clostridiaceae bacterium]|nr:3-phosphoshikimate 1-carboxyvinyltransferase [Clostridiaceae bacterium]
MITKIVNNRIKGEIIVPGSKSHTIRAILLAAMADGKSVIHNPLTSDDCLSALNAARTFGVEVKEEPGVWIAEGKGKNMHVPENFIDTGNSGTTTTFVTSMAALLDGYTFITGDHQIRRRPIKPLADALNELGAQANITRPGAAAPPIVVKGKMHGGKVSFSGFSSQYISSILLSAPLVDGDIEIIVENPLEKPYLQMTLDWMKLYGVTVKASPDFKYFAVKGNQSYKATESTVPSDWSGVAFPLVAAVTTPSEIVIS